jgi:hypothetical protein
MQTPMIFFVRITLLGRAKSVVARDYEFPWKLHEESIKAYM